MLITIWIGETFFKFGWVGLVWVPVMQWFNTPPTHYETHYDEATRTLRFEPNFTKPFSINVDEEVDVGIVPYDGHSDYSWAIVVFHEDGARSTVTRAISRADAIREARRVRAAIAGVPKKESFLAYR